MYRVLSLLCFLLALHLFDAGNVEVAPFTGQRHATWVRTVAGCDPASAETAHAVGQAATAGMVV